MSDARGVVDDEERWWEYGEEPQGDDLEAGEFDAADLSSSSLNLLPSCQPNPLSRIWIGSQPWLVCKLSRYVPLPTASYTAFLFPILTRVTWPPT